MKLHLWKYVEWSSTQDILLKENNTVILVVNVTSVDCVEEKLILKLDVSVDQPSVLNPTNIILNKSIRCSAVVFSNNI